MMGAGEQTAVYSPQVSPCVFHSTCVFVFHCMQCLKPTAEINLLQFLSNLRCMCSIRPAIIKGMCSGCFFFTPISVAITYI